jgi:hypothetical protein
VHHPRGRHLGRDCAIEFLAEGDLLRTTGEAGSASVESQVVWQVLEPTRLAVLDRDFLLSVQPWPEVTAQLLRRQERRAEWLSNVLAISHLPRVELRVLVLFWQFADRWGKVRGGEVSVPIPLTHLNVARLIGARRPTVTTALGRLAEAGLVVQEGNGHWLLRGGPPQQLRDAPAGTASPSRQLTSSGGDGRDAGVSQVSSAGGRGVAPGLRSRRRSVPSLHLGPARARSGSVMSRPTRRWAR